MITAIVAACRGTSKHQTCGAARRRAHAQRAALIVVHASRTSAKVSLDLPDGARLSAAAQAALRLDFEIGVIAGWVRPGGLFTSEPGGATWQGILPARLHDFLADVERVITAPSAPPPFLMP